MLMKKILIVGEIYSDNLGDGVLCKTVKNIIEENIDCEIELLDLSARDYYGEYFKYKWYEKIIKRMFLLAYKVNLVNLGKINVLFKDRYYDKFDRYYDLILFAGGQMFMDYFVFPIKKILNIASKKNIPVIFHACGAKKIKDKYLLKELQKQLSLNIIKLGYRLMLCHDSFIHHYLGTSFRKDEDKFNKIILKNRDYFEKKWNFNVFTFDSTKNNSIFLADSPNDVLDYNCGIGTSLLRIKYLFPNAKIIGLEKDVFKREIAEHFGTIVKDLDELNQKFDTIFIGNALETEEKPLYFIHKLKKYLKEDGVIIGEISNIASLKNIMLLLDNEWYYHNFTKQNHFTKKDLQTMFNNEGYKEEVIYPFKENLEDKNEISKKIKLLLIIIILLNL